MTAILKNIFLSAVWSGDFECSNCRWFCSSKEMVCGKCKTPRGGQMSIHQKIQIEKEASKNQGIPLGSKRRRKESILMETITEPTVFASQKNLVCEVMHKIVSDIKSSDLIFKIIKESLDFHMVHENSHKIVLKFLEFGSSPTKNLIFDAVKKKILKLSLDKYGSEVVKKSLELLQKIDKNELICSLEGFLIRLSKNEFGYSVVQNCVKNCDTNTLFETLLPQVKNLATDRYGFRVILTLLNHSSHDNKIKLFSEIKKLSKVLINDIYGKLVLNKVQ